jgi:ribonucleoside-diphosphate reductase beta chain
MIFDHWIPEKVSMQHDRYDEISDVEKLAYRSTLSFLTALDSIQVNNIPNLQMYITDTLYNGAYVAKSFQELIHSKSYRYITESSIPSMERKDVQDLWRKDVMLKDRNKYIADIYQQFQDYPSDENFAKVVCAEYVLESLYFYNGFMFFYNLLKRGMMKSTAEQIYYIHKDEINHIKLSAALIGRLNLQQKDFISVNLMHEIYEKGVNAEIEWSKHIYGNNIVGISEKSSENYTKFLANERMKVLGFPILFSDITENPYAHLHMISPEDKNGVKENFFETTVTNYQSEAAVDGWDDF